MNINTILFRFFLVSSISCRATQAPEQAPKPLLPVVHQPAGCRRSLSELLNRFLPTIAILLLFAYPVCGQQFAVKTNALYLATGTPNLGAEIGLGQAATVNLTVAYNPWNFNNGSELNGSRLVHWLVEPEYRYWLWEKFNGHYWGIHALYAAYDLNGRNVPFLFDSDHKYKGYGYGLGLSYGFHLMLSVAFGIEAYAGFGVARLSFDKSECLQCAPFLEHISETYIGPTKLGISLIYIIK